MNIRIGNFLYHYRNILFPAVYLLLFLKGRDGPFLLHVDADTRRSGRRSAGWQH